MDRFTSGLVSGLIGGIVMNAWSFLSYSLDITEIRFVDWISVIIYGNLSTTALETVFALIFHIFFVGVLGIGFAYLIPLTTSHNYLLKGVIYSLSIGFILYAIPVMFKVPHLVRIELKTVLSNYFGATLWGLTMAYTLRKLNKKIGI